MFIPSIAASTEAELVEALATANSARFRADVEAALAEVKDRLPDRGGATPHAPYRGWLEQHKNYIHRRLKLEARLAWLDDPEHAELLSAEIDVDDELLRRFALATGPANVLRFVSAVRSIRARLLEKLQSHEAHLPLVAATYLRGDDPSTFGQIEQSASFAISEANRLRKRIEELDAAAEAFATAFDDELDWLAKESKDVAKGVAEVQVKRGGLSLADRSLVDQLERAEANVASLALLGDSGRLLDEARAERDAIAAELSDRRARAIKALKSQADELVANAIAGDVNAWGELCELVTSEPGAFRAGLADALLDSAVRAITRDSFEKTWLSVLAEM
jgi:hypothetical protein